MPESRNRVVGHDAGLEFIRQRIAENAFAGGWLIVGPEGVGKSTLAFQAARAILGATGDGVAAQRAAALIAAGAHPDLFVARPEWNPKTQKFAADIAVSTIRNLIHFMSRTAGMGGWRVAIVDSADELNRNAANALLKVLEEPPSKAVLMLTSARAGRLLATIRSRCRRIELRSVERSVVAQFLREETDGAAGDVEKIADAAAGRPGLALRLALGDGATALAAVEDFIRSSATGRTPESIARLTAKGSESAFDLFETLLLDRLAATIRSKALAGAEESEMEALVAAYDGARDQFARGAGLNFDRVQIAGAVARALARAGVGRMAGVGTTG